MNIFMYKGEPVGGPEYSAGDGITIEDDTISVTTPVNPMTQAEYDALPDKANSGFCIITDSGVSLKDRGEVYSTEETMIGTWIDGRNLYRKTITFIVSKTDYTWQEVLNSNIPNIKEIAFLSGHINRPNGMTNIMATPDNNNEAFKSIPGLMYMTTPFSGSSFTGLKVYIDSSTLVGGTVVARIEYTKTTDEPEVTV